MLCPNKNAYLQLVCPMEPRAINKAVRYAMRKKHIEQYKGDYDIMLPPAQRLESEQPHLSALCVDDTQTRLGYGRLGLQIIIRELNSPKDLVKLQAIYTLMSQVLVPENLFFLLDNHVVYRLIDLMLDNEPIVREKVAIILTRIAYYDRGGKQIISRPVVVDYLIGMIMQDRKEIRYAASHLLKTLTRDRCICEVVIKNDKIIESLLKMIKHDYMEIVIYHINSLKNLSAWDPVPALKANAFVIMKKLMIYTHYRVGQAAMDCLTQLCKHSIGKELADQYDINQKIFHFLLSPNIEVIVSALGLMQYTTTTVRSLWRVKQNTYDIVKRLIALSVASSIPVLQMRAMQVLINLCECSDVRIELKTQWEEVVSQNVSIRSYEFFNGTREITSFGIRTGYNYQTMCVEDVDTIKADYGDSVKADDAHSFISRIRDVKKNLIKAMNTRKDRN